MKATSIKWDVDYEEQLEDLPTEIVLPDGVNYPSPKGNGLVKSMVD